MLLKQYIQNRKAAHDAMQQLHSVTAKETRDFTAEENAKFDQASADFEKWDKLIDREERMAKQSKRIADADKFIPGLEDSDDDTIVGDHKAQQKRHQNDESVKYINDQLFTIWAKRQCEVDLNSEEELLTKRFKFNTTGKTLRIDHGIKRPETRAYATTPTNIGGALVPVSFVTQFTQAMQDFSEFLSLVDMITTDTGVEMRWPTGDDRANIGGIVGQAALIGQDVTTPFGQELMNAWKFTSNIVKISSELLVDSAIDIVGLLGAMFGERLSKAYSLFATTGTGVSQPFGIVPQALIGKTAASNAAITYDDLIDLYHSVDIAYRNSPSCAWMMRDAVVAVIRKLKDSTGQPLWKMDDNIQTLFGKRVVTNRDMAAIASTTKPILFGDLKQYKTRYVGQGVMKRMDERYADTDETGFVYLRRFDGRLLLASAGAVKVLQMAV